MEEIEDRLGLSEGTTILIYKLFIIKTHRKLSIFITATHANASSIEKKCPPLLNGMNLYSKYSLPSERYRTTAKKNTSHWNFFSH